MDVYDAIGVNVERNLDLRNTTRRGRDAYQIELAEHLVVRRHLTLALENADRHGLPIVIGSRIELALLGRDRRVAVDRSEERRVGKECVSTCSYRWLPYH